MKKSIFLAVLLFFLIACNEHNNDRDYSEAIKKTLLERSPYLFKNSIYLKKPYSLDITGLSGVAFCDNFIAGLSRNGTIHLWKKTGEYITQVAKVGKGPGEYSTTPGGFLFLGNTRMIIVDRNRNILNNYSISEKGDVTFLDDFDLAKFNKFAPADIRADSSHIFIYYPFGIKGGPMMVISNHDFSETRSYIPLDRNYFTGGVFKTFSVAEGVALVRAPYNSKEMRFFSPYLYVINKFGKFEHKIDIGYHGVIALDSSNKIIIVDAVFDQENLNETFYYSLSTGKLLHKSTVFNHSYKGVSARENDLKHDGRNIDAGNDNRYFIRAEMSKSKECAAILHIYELNLGIK